MISWYSFVCFTTMFSTNVYTIIHEWNVNTWNSDQNKITLSTIYYRVVKLMNIVHSLYISSQNMMANTNQWFNGN